MWNLITNKICHMCNKLDYNSPLCVRHTLIIEYLVKKKPKRCQKQKKKRKKKMIRTAHQIKPT